jgi:hypothetical protein
MYYNVIDPGAKDTIRVNNKIYGLLWRNLMLLPRQLIQQKDLQESVLCIRFYLKVV